MAYAYQRDSEKLIGVSTETKPENLPLYSRCWDLDTNIKYFWDGTQWQVIGYDEPQPEE